MASENWFAKVEYVCDKSEAVVDIRHIKDLEVSECPAFDILRQYRVFWSPLEEDTPDLMLKRVPGIPVLTEEEERSGLPGYYRACILGINDDSGKFELSRTRRSTKRGSIGNSRKKVLKGKKTVIKGNSRASDTKVIEQRNKNRAVRANVDHSNEENIFAKLDQQFCGDKTDFDSDSSHDPTLVPGSQVKILRAAIKTLKRKLLDQCAENNNLQQKLIEKESELSNLRLLNYKLQEQVLDVVPKLLSMKTLNLRSATSCSSPENGSTANSNYSLLPSNSRSTLSPVASDTSGKRKTPPFSPGQMEKRCTLNPVPLNREDDFPHEAFSAPAHQESNCDVTASSSLQTNSPSVNPEFYTHEDSPATGHFMDISMAGKSSNEPTIQSVVSNDRHSSGPGDNQPELIDFISGHLVLKSALDKIERLPLTKTSDGTFVKELGVCVFGHNVLYNASLAERKFRDKPDTRKKLDGELTEEIRRRLQARVYKEYEGEPVPPADYERFRPSAVNRFLYEKIKQLRRNQNLKEKN